MNKYRLSQNAFSRAYEQKTKTEEEIIEALVGNKHKEIIDVDEPKITEVSE